MNHEVGSCSFKLAHAALDADICDAFAEPFIIFFFFFFFSIQSSAGVFGSQSQAASDLPQKTRNVLNSAAIGFPASCAYPQSLSCE